MLWSFNLFFISVTFLEEDFSFTVVGGLGGGAFTFDFMLTEGGW